MMDVVMKIYKLEVSSSQNIKDKKVVFMVAEHLCDAAHIALHEFKWFVWSISYVTDQVFIGSSCVETLRLMKEEKIRRQIREANNEALEIERELEGGE
jgi:hypothetical protein